jgi:hypothetical protein
MPNNDFHWIFSTASTSYAPVEVSWYTSGFQPKEPLFKAGDLVRIKDECEISEEYKNKIWRVIQIDVYSYDSQHQLPVYILTRGKNGRIIRFPEDYLVLIKRNNK